MMKHTEKEWGFVYNCCRLLKTPDRLYIPSVAQNKVKPVIFLVQYRHEVRPNRAQTNMPMHIRCSMSIDDKSMSLV